MTEKIKILLIKKNMNVVGLAKLLDTPASNIYRKLKRDNFSEKELQQIAEKLGCKYEGSFILENGEKV